MSIIDFKMAPNRTILTLVCVITQTYFLSVAGDDAFLVTSESLKRLLDERINRLVELQIKQINGRIDEVVEKQTRYVERLTAIDGRQEVQLAGLEKEIKMIKDHQVTLNQRVTSEDLMLESQSRAINETEIKIEEIHKEVDPLVQDFKEKLQREQEEKIKNDTRYVKEHFRDVMATDRLRNLNVDQIKEILSSDELNVNSEIEVYEGLMQWIKADAAQRSKNLSELLGLVRLLLIDAKYLVANVSHDPLIQSCLSCT